MNAGEVLDHLRAAEASVRAKGWRLVVEAPEEVLTPEVRAALRRHKQIIIALLGADDPEVAARLQAMRARQCGGGLPFLAVRDVPRGSAGCISCGEPREEVTEGLSVRCRPCALAAWLVTYRPVL